MENLFLWHHSGLLLIKVFKTVALSDPFMLLSVTVQTLMVVSATPSSFEIFVWIMLYQGVDYYFSVLRHLTGVPCACSTDP